MSHSWILLWLSFHLRSWDCYLVSFLQQDGAKCLFVLHGHITAVKSLSFCSTGLALVSGGIGGLLNIWSLQVRKSQLLLLPLLTSIWRSTLLNNNKKESEVERVFRIILCAFLQDGSVLQTVTGLGSVSSTTWIPNLGVAACFGRSKVTWMSHDFLLNLRGIVLYICFLPNS